MMRRVHLEIEIMKVDGKDVTIKTKWVDELGAVRRSKITELMEGDEICWKKFSKEVDF